MLKNSSKKKSSIGFSVGNNVVVLAVFLLTSYPMYTNDLDVMMQAALYGVGNGVQTAHILFSNILIGGFLKLLCAAVPSVAWYTVLQYVVVFLSLTQIGVIFLSKKMNKSGLIIYNILIIFLGYECYMRPSYLKTAALLAASGMYLLWDALKKDKCHFIRLLVVIVELVVASMICWRATLISAVFAVFGMLLFTVIQDIALLGKIRFWVQLMVVLIVTTASGLLFKNYDDSQYTDEQYKLAAEYRNSIERIAGFEYIDYTKELASEVGLEKEAHFHCLMNGLYISKDNKALDVIEQLAGMRKDLSGENILKFFRKIPVALFYVGMFYCWLIFFVLVGVSKIGNKKGILGAAVIHLISCTFVVYFMNLWGRQTAEIVVLIPLCIAIFMMSENISFEDKKKVGMYLLIMSIVLYGRYSNYIITYATDMTMEEELDSKYLYDEKTVSKKNKLSDDELVVGVDTNGEEVKYDNRVHLIDLNAFLKRFPAFTIYPSKLCERRPMIVANGAYGMYSGFTSYTNVPSVTEENDFEWVVGSGKVWKLLINYDESESE